MSEPGSTAASGPALPYATPMPRASRITPAVVFMVTALGMIFLGGCFLIGVLIINMDRSTISAPLPLGSLFLETTLYLVAFGCFGGAIYLISLAVKWYRRGTP